MFRNEFQGGPYVEIFSAQGKDSMSNWKLLNGAGIKKLFDKEVKGYVYNLEGTSTTTKMQLPKDSRHSCLHLLLLECGHSVPFCERENSKHPHSQNSQLTLIQRYLVLQLHLVKGQEFSIELGVTDMHNNKRRIQMSTSQKETQVTPLHARIPLNVVRKAVWLNLCLDMVSLIGETWRGETYRAIETVTLSANCKVKRVFTMKVQPPDTTDDDELYGCSNSNPGEVDSIPKQCQLPPDVTQCTQVLTLNKIRHGERLREGSGGISRPVSTLDLDSSLSSSQRMLNSGSYHIAFGSKVPMDPDTSRKSARQGSLTNRSIRTTSSRLDEGYGTGSHLDTSGNSTSRNGTATNRDLYKESVGSSNSHMRTSGHRTKSETLDENDNQNLSQKGVKETAIVTPHPPREPSSDRRRRRPRVKNVDTKDRQSSAGSVKEEPSSLGNDSYTGDSCYQTVNNTSDLYSYSQSVDRDASDFSSGEAASVWSNVPKREVVGQSVTADKGEQHRHDFPSLQGPRVRQKNPLRSSQDRGVGPNVPEIQTPAHSTCVSVDDSISDVIGLLKSDIRGGNMVEDPDSSDPESPESGARSYESSEEESSDNHLHVFSVRPSSAPHRNVSPNTPDTDAKQTKKARAQRYSNKSTMDAYSSRGARLEEDFINDMTSSEEETTPSRHRKPGSRPHSGSSRPHSGTSNTSSPKTRDQRGGSGGKRGDSGGRTRSVNSVPKVSSISPEQRAGQFNPALYSDQNGGVQGNVISRMSLKDLVQIPSTDARISHANPSQRAYDSTKYQMEDLSESFEAKMFLSMRRQQEEEEAPDSPRRDLATLNKSPRRSHHLEHLGHQMYSESPTTTSDDDTSFSTWKAPAPNQMFHNYQDEMKSRMSSDTLTSSNPRDWSGVYSPPIVLPGDLNNTGHMVEEIPDSTTVLDSPHSKASADIVDIDDEKVNLLFDPSLNCYFDPVTRKYYELKGTPGIG